MCSSGPILPITSTFSSSTKQSCLEQWKRDTVLIVDISLMAFNAITAGAEQAIPETSLLSVIVTLSPSVAVVQVMVFDDELCIKELEYPVDGGRSAPVNAKTTVSDDLREHHILITDIPFVERHGHADQLQGTPRKERDDKNIEELLLVVGICSEQWVGMFRQVVCAVIFPQRGHAVHQAVVPIEPEVDRDAVESNLKRQPAPVERERELLRSVGQVDGHGQAKSRNRKELRRNPFHANIRDVVAFMLVSIQEAVDQPEPAYCLYQMDTSAVERRGVQPKDGERVEGPPSRDHICLLENMRNHGV